MTDLVFVAGIGAGFVLAVAFWTIVLYAHGERARAASIGRGERR